MALWPSKKDPSGEATPGADDLQALTEQLGQLSHLLDEANQQVAAYLIRRETQTAPVTAAEGPCGPLADKLEALAEKFDQLAELAPPENSSPAPSAVGAETLEAALRPLSAKLEGVEATFKALAAKAADPREAISAAVAQIAAGANAHHEAVAAAIAQLQQHLDSGIQRVAELLRPAEPEPSDLAPAAGSDWQRALLGSELADQPELAAVRQQLLDGVLAGEKAARSLVGQLLVFQSAAAEKMPPLLKEIGEAYYRWQPKTTSDADPMETALATWLKKACDEAGIGNTIELVHPGQRFDSTRHTASQRGVEISEVFGWIVLRDNGRVYTKATVTVK